MERKSISLNVLLVDDSDAMRLSIRSVLSKLGIKKVSDAVDGLDAWKKIQEAHQKNEPFDTVFLDWNMPRMNGPELLLNCRSNELFKELYIIMTTAEREQKSIIQALKYGANDYIVKPYNANTIISKLSQHKKVKEAA